jgi:hypothetical protein
MGSNGVVDGVKVDVYNAVPFIILKLLIKPYHHAPVNPPDAIGSGLAIPSPYPSTQEDADVPVPIDTPFLYMVNVLPLLTRAI